jgi:hypothetical protein
MTLRQFQLSSARKRGPSNRRPFSDARYRTILNVCVYWVPAFAGMTAVGFANLVDLQQ